jgi:hypothetical protein
VPWGVNFPGVEGFRHPVSLYDGLKTWPWSRYSSASCDDGPLVTVWPPDAICRLSAPRSSGRGMRRSGSNCSFKSASTRQRVAQANHVEPQLPVRAVDRDNGAATPSVLQRFVDRISWTTIPFSTAGSVPVYFAAPRLGDLFGEERLHAEMISHSINPHASRGPATARY